MRCRLRPMRYPEIFGLFLFVFFASILVEASEAPSLMRPGHVLPEGAQAEVSLQLDLFDKSFDITHYASKLGTSAKPSKFRMSKLGVNYKLSPAWTLRSELMYGSQTIVRALAPTSFSPDFHSETVLLQWHPHDWVIEGGVVNRGVLHKGFNTFQTNNLTVTAAPGQELVGTSAKDISLLAGVAYPVVKTDRLNVRLGSELQYSKVQATYRAPDPLVQLIVGQQAPQTTPWHEWQGALIAGVDYQLSTTFSTGLDVKFLQIQRKQYEPRIGLKDYTTATIFDIWGGWNINEQFSLIMRGHANSNYLLGEIPSFYNRRVNSKFKYPFGYVTLGIVYTQ